MAASTKKKTKAAPTAANPLSPPDWRRQLRIQWSCVLLELLGERSLELLPHLLSGSKAFETSYQATGYAQAIAQNRRHTGPLPTRRAVQKAVRDLYTFAREAGVTPAYRIDEASLLFTREEGKDDEIERARAVLLSPLAHTKPVRKLAQTEDDLVVRLREDNSPVNIPLRLAGLTPPPPAQHNLHRTPARELTVSLAALRTMAEAMDAQDEAAQRFPREEWGKRLQDIIVDAWGKGQLRRTEELDLTGLRHLIGLPGSGKTTLITLLCAHLAAAGLRVAVFFTSIETARDYLERLRNYQVQAGLLVGRGPATHARHADRLAQLIAAQGHDGFADTRAGADLLAQTCPLPAFAVDETTAWREWRPTETPCEKFYLPDSLSKDNPQALLCPLWSQCGRVKNQRELVTAPVWLGHVRSADTQVPAHTSTDKLQYFELLAEHFDLLIFDEADESQRLLDDLGALTLELGGTHESIHMQAQRVTGMALTGGVASLRERELLLPHVYAANTFERHLIRFYDTVSRLNKEELGKQLEQQLLTTNYLIRFALERVPVASTLSSDYRAGLYDFWDSAVYAAFYGDARPEQRVADWQRRLGFKTEKKARKRWEVLVAALATYLHALYHDENVQAATDALSAQLNDLLHVPPAYHSLVAPVAQLLVEVGFAVASYQKLARIAQSLSQFGLLPDSLVGGQISEALRLLVPVNLLGPFSAVRFRYGQTGRRAGQRFPNVVIDYLLLDATPRLLLHRLHGPGRAHVLLASATSWLPDSPAYHLGVAPSYVLRSARPAPVQIQLRCQPIAHPERPHDYLRFSGAAGAQFENLAHMVASLARADATGTSALERDALFSSGPRKRRRLAALIVNSYEQVQLVMQALVEANKDLAKHARGIVRTRPTDGLPAKQYLLKGQVELLGQLVDNEGVQVVVFPFTALGRGINIVFNDAENIHDPDNRTAAIGTVYFLTRPHPTAGDVSLLLSTIAQHTEHFDLTDFATSSLATIAEAFTEQRHLLYKKAMSLLARPLSAHRLPKEFIRPFAANLLIPILQTIGRAIRGGSPANVYFVDAAWAPHSAEWNEDNPRSQADDNRSSVLVTMQELFADYLSKDCPPEWFPPVLAALYAPFAQAFAFDSIEGLIAKHTN